MVLVINVVETLNYEWKFFNFEKLQLLPELCRLYSAEKLLGQLLVGESIFRTIDPLNGFLKLVDIICCRL